MSRDIVELYRRLPVTAADEWWVQRAAASSDGRVLYLGCGTGRLALPIAAACSLLVGVDVDPGMLEAFAARVGEELTGRVDLVRASARELDLGDRFGLVVLPSNLLNGIVDPAERAQVVHAAADHCREDGQVVMQVLNPYWMAARRGSGAGVLEPRGPDGERVEVGIEQITFDPWEQRQRATLVYRFPDGRELIDHIDAVALYPRELRALAYGAGLEISQRLGSDPRSDLLGRDGGTWHLVCGRRVD
ncbi:MAG TPA: class I SAM-dependent methyltransferase [Nitriliruptorales bacterium]